MNVDDTLRRRLPADVQVALDAAEQAGHQVHFYASTPRCVDIDSEMPFDDVLVLLLWRAGFRLNPRHTPQAGFDHARCLIYEAALTTDP